MKHRGHIIELGCWITAIVIFTLSAPGDDHYTICPLALTGIAWCPGCGLGRSIICIMHGEWQDSFRYHWLGFPALVILSHRIVLLANLIIRDRRINGKTLRNLSRK